jgi:hypothetical protein
VRRGAEIRPNSGGQQVVWDQLLVEQTAEAARIILRELTAELITLDITGDVGAPCRVHQEFDSLLGTRPRQQRPAGELVCDDLWICPLLMKSPRRGGPDGTQHLTGVCDLCGNFGVVLDPKRSEVALHLSLVVGTHHDSKPQVCQTFCKKALRSADEEDRLLQPFVVSYEANLFAAVLGVVPGIGLVSDEVRKRKRQDR